MIVNREYDIFLITKDNWREQENLFFGYKTVDNEGMWLDVKNIKNKLIITGSYIQPAIAIYNQNNFWAISNSCKVLVDYLTENNYTLTNNDEYIEQDLGLDGYAFNYPEISTKWKEINLNPNFSHIEISNDSLYVIEEKDKENLLFSKDLKDGKEIIDEWFKKYYFYIFKESSKDNTYITASVSGGLDSRFLINFWKNAKINKIVSKWAKNDTETGNRRYIDGLIARLVISTYTSHKSKINAKLRTVNLGKTTIPEIEDELFWYGIAYKPNEQITIKKVDKNSNIKTTILSLSGVGTEWLKAGAGCKDPNFILGTARRFFISKFIKGYYLGKLATILPYLDSSLLQLRGVEDNSFLYLLYLLYSPEMLEIPFYNNTQIYVPIEAELEKARLILREWNNEGI